MRPSADDNLTWIDGAVCAVQIRARRTTAGINTPSVRLQHVPDRSGRHYRQVQRLEEGVGVRVSVPHRMQPPLVLKHQQRARTGVHQLGHHQRDAARQATQEKETKTTQEKETKTSEGKCALQSQCRLHNDARITTQVLHLYMSS